MNGLIYLIKVLFSKHHYYLTCELRCFYDLCIIIIVPETYQPQNWGDGDLWVQRLIPLTVQLYVKKGKQERKKTFQTFLSEKQSKWKSSQNHENLVKFTTISTTSKIWIWQHWLVSVLKCLVSQKWLIPLSEIVFKWNSDEIGYIYVCHCTTDLWSGVETTKQMWV